MKQNRWRTGLASAGAGTLLGCAAGAALSGWAGSFSNGAFYVSALLFIVGVLGGMKGGGSRRAMGPPVRGFTAGNVAVSQVGQTQPEHPAPPPRDLRAVFVGLAAAGVLMFGISLLAAKLM